MKIVNAVWEERNLGVTTTEITLEPADSAEAAAAALAADARAYAVVKVPAGEPQLLQAVQAQGFIYIEDMIHVEHDLHEIEMNGVLKRLYDKMPYRLMDDADFAELLSEIERGMFDHDRISNDSFFPEGISARRYRSWALDLREQGALFYLITYGTESAGFIALKKQDDATYYSVLGGGYEKFRNTGLGIVQKEPEITRKLGGKRVITSVSSNNPGQLRALIRNGYQPYAIEHVLIRHR